MMDSPSPHEQAIRPRALPIWLARAGFAGALAATLLASFAPQSDAPSLLPWDKAQHFLAFYVLAAMAAAAFARRPTILIVAGLAGLGAAIELVQATPWVSRDGDFWDWIADLAGTICALAPMALVTLRQRLAGRTGFPWSGR